MRPISIIHVDETLMDRTTAVKHHLQAGKSVCPFARACPLQLATVSTNPRTDRADILQAVATFAAERGNALVLLATADEDFTATTVWTREAFLELMVCCSQISHPTVPVPQIEDHVERTVRPILSSHEIRPYLSLHAKTLMTICMAPIYPAAHPRYAPHTILVVTWSDDVTASQDTGATSKIRETMARTHGHVYDANELMLPLPVAEESRTRKPHNSLTTTGQDRDQIIDLRDALIARGNIGELSMPDQDLFQDCNIALGLVRCEPQARDEARIRVLCVILSPTH